ncbi:LysR family transcriptional regulator [uncultured Paracoccus sp.]|uniref:LysR family transcriptional regulator n=1 Tax=uncultured Paracoccus sp. TaxID=189685 RepID=UPI0026323F21|nr:LysR family transcriptional regulator [uncultured Paracoccus sp.]
MDRLSSVRAFCTVAETMQFRAAAQRLGVSPQVVTRLIAELERELGEPLLMRSTRQVRLTAFGESWLPGAAQLVADSERLFLPASAAREIRGLVSVTVPDFPIMGSVLEDLLDRLVEFPDLQLDWRASIARAEPVMERVDLGVRVGPLSDSGLIIRQVGKTRDRIVASPELIARHGLPHSLDDLHDNFPLSVILNPNTGRPWPWYLRADYHFHPQRPRIVAGSVGAHLSVALKGIAIGAIQEIVCQPYLQSGALVEILAEEERLSWPLYVWRQQTAVTQPKVRVVFDTIVDSLQRRLSGVGEHRS